jgi:hypothetical protein
MIPANQEKYELISNRESPPDLWCKYCDEKLAPVEAMNMAVYYMELHEQKVHSNGTS